MDVERPEDVRMKRLLREILDGEFGPHPEWSSSPAAQVVLSPPASRLWPLVRASRYLAIAALLALAAFTALLVAGALRPAPSEPTGVLAITDPAGLDFAAWNGSDRRPIVTDGPAFNPAWSWDGSRLAIFQVTDEDPNLLRVLTPDGSVAFEMLGVFQLRWQKAGASIAIADPSNRIRVVSPAGEPGPPLIQPSPQYSGLGFDWSPDGLRIVMATCANCDVTGSTGPPVFQLWFIDPSIGPPTRLVGERADRAEDGGHSPVWSPDGRSIAYVVPGCPDGTCAGSIRIVDAATGERRAEIEDLRGPADPAWSPDGRRIAYVAEPAEDAGPLGRSDLYVTTSDMRTTVQLTAGPEGDVLPLWDAAGDWLMFRRAIAGDRPRTEIWATRPDGSEARRVVDDSHGAAWQPLP